VNSLFSRESVLRAYGLDAKVCYLGVDTRLFHPTNEARENFVIGIGSFIKEKNIDLVLHALAAVKAPRPRFVWVGNLADERTYQEVKQLADRLGVNFSPKLKIDDGELVALLNRARLMIYAPRLEPFGLAPLEANACGLPVVAVAEGGIRETITDGVNGLLVESDPRALAGAIKRLLRDHKLADELGHNASKLVTECWGIDASIDRLEGRLREVVDKTGVQDRRAELSAP